MDASQSANVTNSSRRNRWLWPGLAGLILAVLLVGKPFAAFSDDRLFSPVVNETVPQPNNSDAAALRGRPVRVNWQSLTPDTDTIRLNLFPDLTLTATHWRIDPSHTGGFTWVGQIVEQPGTVTLAVQGTVLSGIIYLEDNAPITITYQPGPTGDIHFIRAIDPDAPEPNGLDAVLPPTPDAVSDLVTTQESTCVENGSVIDILVTYTTAAREAMGGTEAALATINRMISDMNTANSTSLANFTWRLVGTEELAYIESGDLLNDLNRLQNSGDGIIDEVHALRATQKADMVSMLVAQGTNNTCGIAYQMTSPGAWFGDYAFSIAALDYPGPAECSPLVMAHEFGHNLGNAHDRANTSVGGSYPYSYGYQSPPDTVRFRDIMAYNCPDGCPRLNLWANPNVLYEGEPTGIDYDIDPANAADIARSMNDTRSIAANFQPNCVTEPEATSTPEGATATATSAATATFAATATSAATSTMIPTATATPTDPLPTLTPTATPTNTPEAANTPQPSATSTLPPSPTSPPTFIEPSPMPTATPTAIPTLAPQVNLPFYLPFIVHP